MIREMQDFDWSPEKNEWLKKERKLSFEMVIEALKEGKLLNIENATNERYKHQFYYIIEIEGYAYVVPFVIDKKRNIHFLKTIYASRKATKKYLHK